MPPLLNTLGRTLATQPWQCSENLGHEKEDARAMMFSLQALEILLLCFLGECCRLLTDLLFGSVTFLFAWAFNSPQVPLPSFSPFSQSSSPHKMKESSPLGSRKISDKIHFQTIHSESSDTFSDQSPTMARGLLIHQSKAQTEMQFVNEEDLEALGAAAPPLSVAEELKAPASSTAQTSSKSDSPSRKKGMKARVGSPLTPRLHPRDTPALSSFRSVREGPDPWHLLCLIFNLCSSPREEIE